MRNLLQGLFILLFIATGAILQERTIKGTIAAKEAPNPLQKQALKLNTQPMEPLQAQILHF